MLNSFIKENMKTFKMIFFSLQQCYYFPFIETEREKYFLVLQNERPLLQNKILSQKNNMHSMKI